MLGTDIDDIRHRIPDLRDELRERSYEDYLYQRDRSGPRYGSPSNCPTCGLKMNTYGFCTPCCLNDLKKRK
jgi:hypothetical protein